MSDVFIQVDNSGLVIGRFSRPQGNLPNIFKVSSSAFDGKTPPYKYQNGQITSDISGLKASLKRAVEAAYMARSQADYSYNGKAYQADAAGRNNLEAGLLAVLAGKATIDWTAKDNTRTTFTAAQFKELCTGIFDRGQALFVTMRTKKDEVDALNSSAAAQVYDVNAGW